MTTALAFDGVDNNVKIADSANLRPTTALTIEAWVNTGDNFTANSRTIFSKTVGTGTQDSYIVWYSGGQLHAVVGNTSTGTTTLNYDWNPAQNTWHRIAFTYDATGPKLYVDGVLAASNTSTATIGYDTHPVIIGDDYNNEQLGQAWSGKLAEISLWNIALTPAQILATTTLTGAEAGLIGYWRLNEGSGTVAHDLSSGGNNGVIAGTGPVWVTNRNGSVSLQGGTLSGSGDVAADLTNAAQINVGGTGTAGGLVVTGNYTQTATGVLNIEVGGTVAATQFDQLQIDGVATLAGTLNISLINNFQPSSGQTFEVETFDSHIGSFATISGLPAGLQANYTSTDLLLVSQVIGITVTPTFGLVTTEAGGTTSFSVVLDGAPTSDVFIDIESDNEAEGTVSVKTLHFTPQNWNVPQIVTVTGVDDAVQDGDVVYHVILRKAVSGDPSYNGFDPSDVTLTNLDNDHAGFTVTPVSGLVTTESGGQASYTIALSSQPTANVTVSLTSSAPSEGTVTPLSLTFTAQNWNQAQSVTVTGVDDQLIDGDVALQDPGHGEQRRPEL
ncbi:MAG: LamG-like jellyroll fold domain-containing protein [Bradyrhizobium sp.]